MTNWHMHGLVVRCDGTDLDAQPAPSGAHVDVDLVMLRPGPILAHGEQRPGRVLAAREYGAGSMLSVVEVPSATGAVADVMIDFHGLAVARITQNRSVVELVLADDADPALAPVLLCGTVFSTLLILRGHPVLHASGVSVHDGRAEAGIAFVGHSGMGKSTMATLLCRDGAELLSDDVLRTDLLDGGQVVAWPGATATRLRAAAGALGHQASDDTVITADGRLSTRLRPASPRPVPLRALVVPQPDRETDALHVTRMRGASAVLTLAAFPRVLGWVDPVTTRQAHHHWGALARAVPVLMVRVPWGPPFGATLGSDLTRAIVEESSAG